MSFAPTTEDRSNARPSRRTRTSNNPSPPTSVPLPQWFTQTSDPNSEVNDDLTRSDDPNAGPLPCPQLADGKPVNRNLRRILLRKKADESTISKYFDLPLAVVFNWTCLSPSNDMPEPSNLVKSIQQVLAAPVSVPTAPSLFQA